MPNEAESWLPIANTLGFLNETEMLQNLYCIQGFSLSQLKSILGFSAFNIRGRLIKAGIPLRSKGGPNNRLGCRRLKHLTNEELKAPAVEISKKHQVHLSTVYAEIKFRRKELQHAILSHYANQSIREVRQEK